MEGETGRDGVSTEESHREDVFLAAACTCTSTGCALPRRLFGQKQRDGRRGGEVRKEKRREGRRDPRRGEGQPALHLSPWKRSDLKIIRGHGGGEHSEGIQLNEQSRRGEKER